MKQFMQEGKHFYCRGALINLPLCTKNASLPLHAHQCCRNSIHIENTEIEHLKNRDFSAVESFQVLIFRYEGLVILGILGFFTISKPKINLKHTVSVNFFLKTIYQTLISKISKYQNQKIENRRIRIEISKSG